MIYAVNKIISEKHFFKDLNEHDAEHEAVTEDMHSTQLIKMLANDFFTIKLQRYGQLYTEKVFKKRRVPYGIEPGIRYGYYSGYATGSQTGTVRFSRGLTPLIDCIRIYLMREV